MKKPLLALALLWLWVALVASAAAESLQETRAKAKKGDAVAQWSLGMRYAKGDGVRKNWGQARVWMEKAAAQGNLQAIGDLGVIYLRGYGVKQDYDRARSLLEKSANGGHPTAQLLLGDMYADGKGVKQDYAQARAWYEKAATQGDAEAQVTLGLMYERGEGGEKDLARARELYQKASERGQNEAGKLLAELAIAEGPAEGGKVVQANQGKEGQPIDPKSLAVEGRRVLVFFYSPLHPPGMELTPRLERFAAKTDWIVMQVNIDRPGVKETDWDSPLGEQLQLDSKPFPVLPYLVLLDRQGKTAAEGGRALRIIEWQMQRAGVE